MQKVTINGEVFEFDNASKPLAEGIALEAALQMTYGEWEEALQKGSARAMAGYVWLVWRRDGRDVLYQDIVSGAVEVNMETLDVENSDGDRPTNAKEASPTNGDATLASSPSSSDSDPGTSTA